jgi:hypothetical protein
MAGPGRPLGSPNVRSEKPFGEALCIEIAAAGRDYKALRAIARNLLHLASQPEMSALPAIREIADRLDGKARQETEISLRTAIARDVTDDDLAAIAIGTDGDHVEPELKPDPTKH